MTGTSCCPSGDYRRPWNYSDHQRVVGEHRTRARSIGVLRDVPSASEVLLLTSGARSSRNLTSTLDWGVGEHKEQDSLCISFPSESYDLENFFFFFLLPLSVGCVGGG